MPGQQKSMTGTVVSDKMEKTVVVVVETTSRHRLYHKIMKRTKRYLAHDDRLGAKPGDLVRLLETRPLSRHKRWRVAEIIQRGEVAEIAPKEIDAEYLSRQREVEAPPAPQPAAEATGEVSEPAPGAEMPTEEAEAPDAEASLAEESAPLEEPPAEETATAEEQEQP